LDAAQKIQELETRMTEERNKWLKEKKDLTEKMDNEFKEIAR